MKKIIFALVFLLISYPAKANDLFELDKVQIDYKSFANGGHDPMIQDSGLVNRQADKYIDLGLDMSFLYVFYFNNVVHGTSDTPITGTANGQFRTVGWQYELGVRVTDYLNVGMGHHSQHMLDYEGVNHFPVENWVGFSVKLFESKREKGKIW